MLLSCFLPGQLQACGVTSICVCDVCVHHLSDCAPDCECAPVSLLPHVSQCLLALFVMLELNLASVSPLPTGTILCFASRGRQSYAAGGRASPPRSPRFVSLLLLIRAGHLWSLFHPCVWLSGEFCRQLI